MRCFFQRQRKFRKKRVVHIRKNTADQAGVGSAEPSGYQIFPIPVLPAKLKNPPPQFLTDAGAAVEGAGYRGAGDVCHTGNFLDRNRFQQKHPHRKRLHFLRIFQKNVSSTSLYTLVFSIIIYLQGNDKLFRVRLNAQNFFLNFNDSV